MAKIINDYIESFNSPFEMVEAISRRPVNKEFASSVDSSSHYVGTNDGWYATESFKDACELMENGDAAALSLLEEVGGDMDGSEWLPAELRYHLEKSVCGGFPSVPLALVGAPKCMLSPRRVSRPSPVVDIIYNASFSCRYSAKGIATAGAKMLSVVNALETAGVRVALHVADGSEHAHQRLACRVNVKNADEPLNLLRTAFLLANGDFCRRLVFAWMETCPVPVKRNFHNFYGSPLSILNSIFVDAPQNTYYINGTNLVNVEAKDWFGAIFKNTK